ncbi:MAG: hypothetical protein J6Q61_06515 [Bacteroidales bacterium]|nr:hypothetical protein [Bacteroidales bacterium]
MSLDSNTTELNEILDMAKGLPEAAVQEIAYVDCEFDFANFSVASVGATYDEITAMIEAGKYVVFRATYALISSPVNTMFLPISLHVKEQNLLLITGMTQARINDNLVLLHIACEYFSDGEIETNVRVVSVTDIN